MVRRARADARRPHEAIALDEDEDEAEAELDQEDGDEEAYRRDLAALLDYVHRNGTPVSDDDFRPSDQVLPDPTASLAEVKALLEEEHAG